MGGVGKCGDSELPAIFVRVGDPEVLSFIHDATGLEPGKGKGRTTTTTTTTTTSNSSPDPCSVIKCGTNAKCISRGILVSCKCLNGYTGDADVSCNPIDPCNPNPCGRNADCTPRNNGFVSCKCPSGFRGDPFTRCSSK